jgi:two-component system LytT family sensor kinase
VHGLDSHAGAVCVTVRAVVQGAQVVLTVENDGSTLETARAPAGNGVGLAATRARLMTAYGDDASLQLQPREGGGVVVRISLPVVRPALPHRTATRVPVEVA